MKRTIFAIVLAFLSFFVALRSSGQGYVAFENYDFGATSLNAPVTFGMTYTSGGISGVTGVRVGSEFKADLLYSLDDGATYSLLSGAQSGSANYPTPFSGTDGDTASGAGYFIGDSITIPGYTSGAITFIVRAYSGPSYNNSAWFGESSPFAMPSITTTTISPSHFSGMDPFQVVFFVPEPSIFALAGVGAAGLIAFRRKK
jgi:hypothetical protein